MSTTFAWVYGEIRRVDTNSSDYLSFDEGRSVIISNLHSAVYPAVFIKAAALHDTYFRKIARRVWTDTSYTRAVEAPVGRIIVPLHPLWVEARLLSEASRFIAMDSWRFAWRAAWESSPPI